MASDVTPVRAQENLRVVVRLMDESDDKVLLRIHGQTSDLPVTLVPIREPMPASGVADQVAAASALAAREHADAVVWFSHNACPATDADRGGMVVHIGQARTGSVLARVVGDPKCVPRTQTSPSPAPTDDNESANLEMVAIVVRNALLAITEGGTIGVAAPAAALPAPSTVRARLAAGWMLVLDGLAPHGHQGVGAAIGVGGARFGVELAAASTLPASITDQQTTVAVSRTTVALGGYVSQTLGSSRLVGTVALQAGAIVQSRTTTARRPDVGALPNSRYTSSMASAELRLAWPIPMMRGFGVVVGLAADYLPTLPIIAYIDEQGRTVESRRPWMVQPRITAGCELRLP